MSGIDVESLPACTDCVRPMRPRAARAADYPGSVHTAARGRCDVCYRAYRRGIEAAATQRRRAEVMARRMAQRGAPSPDGMRLYVNPDGVQVAVLTLDLGRYDGSPADHQREVRRAQAAWRHALAVRHLRGTARPPVVINPQAGHVQVTAPATGVAS